MTSPRRSHLKYVVVALLTTCAATAEATDYARFFSYGGTVQVVRENGRARQFPGGHDEKYWAEDPAGTKFKLRLKNALPNYAEVGVSAVSESLGLPTATVFPILLRRGSNGVPGVAEAKALDPSNTFLGLSGAQGEWFPATIQEVAPLEIFRWEKLGGAAQADLLGQLLLNGILGNNDLQFGNGKTGNIGFDGARFLTLDATQSFKFFPQESGEARPVRKFLAAFGDAPVARLDEVETGKFMARLNDIVTRAEGLDRATIELFFQSYFRSVKTFRTAKGMPEFDYAGEVLRRLKQARGECVDLLGRLGVIPSALRELKAPSAVAPLVGQIQFPKLMLSIDAIPSAKTAAAAELLGAFYYQDFWKARGAAENYWSNELGTAEPLEELHRQAFRQACTKGLGAP